MTKHRRSTDDALAVLQHWNAGRIAGPAILLCLSHKTHSVQAISYSVPKTRVTALNVCLGHVVLPSHKAHVCVLFADVYLLFAIHYDFILH